MLGRQKQQLNFTDINVLQAWEQKPLVPEDSFYYGLSQAEDIFRDELFADCYASCGRPPSHPAVWSRCSCCSFTTGRRTGKRKDGPYTTCAGKQL